MTKEKLSQAERNKRYQEKHPERVKASQLKWREENKEYNSIRQRKYQLRSKYGITEEDYNEMFKSQEGLCGICKTPSPTGKWQRFGVDHCHETGKVRALLCNECNRGIGLLKDNSELLRKAADYIDFHKLITKQENVERINDQL